MHDNTLQFKRLFYENMGNEPYYLRNFFDTIEYLDEPFSEITIQVIRLLLGDMEACDACHHEDSRIEARVQIGKDEYSVTVVFEDGVAKFYVTDERGADRTLWYLQTVAHTREEQELCFFFRRPGLHPVRLQHYREYPADFWNTTAAMSTTQTFRCYMRRFIRKFQPHQLLAGKNYWLHLEKDGKFTVRLGKGGEEISCLSETENYLYHYLCFLYFLDFWSGMDKLRNYKDVKLPIFIRAFSDRLDEGVAILPFYAMAAKRNRQVIIVKT